VAWWRDYVIATKGKKQVTVSRGLKLAGDADLVTEGEAEEVRQPDTGALVALTPRGLRAADRAGLLLKVLDAAEAKVGDATAARIANRRVVVVAILRLLVCCVRS
jgi:hypothetical protein